MLVDVASVGKYCDIFHNRLVNLDVISNFIGAHLPAYTGYRGQAGAGARAQAQAQGLYNIHIFPIMANVCVSFIDILTCCQKS